MKKVVLFGEHISWRRIVIILSIGVIAVLSATTVGEFAVSVHNRYSLYPAGADTNMYGNSAIGQMLVVLAAASIIGYLLRKKFDVGVISIALVLFIIFAVLSSQIHSFVPEDWCRYELTMYPCADQIDYNWSIKQ